MQKKSLLTFGILGMIVVLFILYIPRINAQATAGMGSDWKWAYCQDHTEDDMIKIGMIITDEDMEFAKMRVAAAEEDCIKIAEGDKNSNWCIWAEKDRQALQRMLSVQGKSGTISVPKTSIFGKAWQQLRQMMESVELIKKILGEALYCKITRGGTKCTS